MAENTATGPLQQLTNVSQLHIVRQLVLLVGLAGSIALGVAVVLWAKGDEYRYLDSGHSPEDRLAVMATLDQRGLSYQMDPRTGEISVAEADLATARMAMATAGLPSSNSSGLSGLEQDSGIGASRALERARLQQILQNELAQAIESMDAVLSAKVTLAIPRGTGFLRSNQKPSASVIVKTLSGSALNYRQVAGIRNLVASSVVGLTSNHVAIIDTVRGEIPPEDEGGYGGQRDAKRHQEEQKRVDAIIDMLSNVLGPGRAVASVIADMDFSEEESTVQDYGPNLLPISQQSNREETSQEDDVGGVPGLLDDDLNANPDGLDAEPTILKEKSERTVNNVVATSITHKKIAPGRITHLSVSVLIDSPERAAPVASDAGNPVNPDTEAQVQAQAEPAGPSREELLEMIRTAVDFREERGDTISLVDSDFFQVETENVVFEDPSILENPLFWKGMRYGGAGLVVLFIIFGVLRPVLKSSLALTNNLPGRNPAGLAYADGTMPEGYEGFDGEDQVTLTGGNPGNRLAAPNTARRYENNLAQVRAIVESEPDRAARVIQGWVADD